MTKRLLVIELNEFNIELLTQGCKKLKLNNIKKVLEMNSCDTKSPDLYEHFGLDPWVQWVSIHTGKPKEIHQVEHLGDVTNLNNKQIWEEVGLMGFKTGIWGAMNASFKNAINCCFFLPDPWTFSEVSFPSKLNEFLALPRYYSKNYLNYSKFHLFIKLMILIKFILSDWNFIFLRKEIIFSINVIFKYGLNNCILFSLHDLISSKLFLKFKKKYDTNLSIIFLNCLAHAQHEIWSRNILKKDMKIILIIIDKILGNFFTYRNPNESLLVMNGLGQKNVDGEKYCIYRQKNPAKFLKSININYKKIEQCMTNESHIFFDKKSDLNNALKILKSAKIKGKSLFSVEINKTNENRLFYQLNYFKYITKNEKFNINKKEYSFYEFFTLLAIRTGSHIQEGTIFHDNLFSKDKIFNHEIYKYLKEYFS